MVLKFLSKIIRNSALITIELFDYFHKKKIIAFLKKKKIKEFKIIFDIGAHKGETISLMLKNFKSQKIYSFEASKKNFKNLESNVLTLRKKYKNIELIPENIALDYKSQKIMFKQFTESSSSTFSLIDENSKYYKKKYNIINFFEKKKQFEEFEIKTTTAEKYINDKNIKNIDFVKIDTEGYEYEILKGFGKMIKNVKIIMFEHHYDNMIKKSYTFSEINNLLKKNGFCLVYKSKMPFRKTFEYIYFEEKN